MNLSFDIFISFLDDGPIDQINVCFTANVNSPGNDIETRNGVASVEDCQEICRSNPSCSYFVYGKTHLSGSCFLKSEKVDHLTQQNGLLFGPKQCRKLFLCLSIELLAFNSFAINIIKNYFVFS